MNPSRFPLCPAAWPPRVGRSWPTRFLLVAIGVALASAVGCGGASERRPGPLRVVVATSIPGDLARRVAGPDAEVTVLAGANSDPHSFTPSTAQAKALADADLVVTVGLQFAPWLPKLVESSGTKARQVELAAGLPDLMATDGDTGSEDAHDDHGHDHGHDDHGHDHDGLQAPDDDHDHGDHDHADEADDHDHEHAHGPVDPHVWHDVTNGIHMVKALRDALVEADAEHAEGYRERAARLVGELEDLHEWVQDEVQKVPDGRRLLVTAHDNMRYFARRYGFEVVADFVGSVSTQHASPSMGAAAKVLDLIRARDVPAVFAENTTERSFIDGIAADAGVPVHTLFTDSLGHADRDQPASYVELMRHNVRTIVEALGEE